jgi:hypothetical protein
MLVNARWISSCILRRAAAFAALTAASKSLTYDHIAYIDAALLETYLLLATWLALPCPC